MAHISQGRYQASAGMQQDKELSSRFDGDQEAVEIYND